jgi:two-component system cell cycle sensor histidine kinase/response regulator CckA
MADFFARFLLTQPNLQIGVRSMMMIPLISKDQVIGVLHFRSLQPNIYSDRDLRLAERVSTQIAGTIANAQLFAERKQAEEALRESEEAAKRLAQENAIMAEIGRIISSTLDIEEVYERFAEEVRKFISFDRVAINTINIEEGNYTIAYTIGGEITGLRQGNVIPLANTLTEEIVRTRSSLFIQVENKTDLTERFPILLPTFEAGFRSLMSVPLISKDRVIGVLHFRSTKSNAYTEMGLKLAERVGNQISGAIANAQLFSERKQAEEALRESEEAAKRLAQENAIMAEIGRIISSTLDIEEVYEHFAEEVRKLIPFDRIVIAINNVEEKTIAFAYASGTEVPGRKVGTIIPFEGSINQHIALTRSSLLVHGEEMAEYSARFPLSQPILHIGVRSMMLIPLISKDQVIGVLHFRSLQPNDYSETDLRLAERVGTQIAGAIANAQLFAERKRGEEALKKSEAKFQKLFDEAPVGYMELDSEGHIVQVNRTELAMLGYTVGEMLGQPVWKFVAEEEKARQTVKAKLAGSMQMGQNFERNYKQKGGTTLPILIKDALIRDAEGKVTGIHSTIQDITERKRAEAELEALQEQLRQSQKMEAIGHLAGGVAHDFNNLLTVIKGYSQLSLSALMEGDPLKENIEEIQKASQRAADLTRQLLAFSRRQILDFKVLDLNSIVQNLNKMLRRILGEDIELVTLLREDLGKVKTDPGQMEQVILNLAVNARDAMPSGGILRIETANAELNEEYARTHLEITPGPYVILSVSDTGCGMSPEVKEKIFEPFFTTKEIGKGTGLGLSTIYGIVKQSGGSIWVDSEPGQGTLFKIYLPRVEEGARDLHQGEATGPIRQGNETLLLVEDEPSVRSLTARILRNQGYRVLEAANGEEALSVAQEQTQERIDLLVTDVVMPRMGGKELADRIKILKTDIKVLFTSGYTDHAIVHQGMLDPGTNFLQKPFSPMALSHKVREVLER